MAFDELVFCITAAAYWKGNVMAYLYLNPLEWQKSSGPFVLSQAPHRKVHPVGESFTSSFDSSD
jgi:hypothetical protein